MVKNPLANAGNSCLIPESGASPGGGHGNAFQYSYLENSMDRGAWQATVHGVAESPQSMCAQPPGILHLGPPRGREQQWMKGLTLPTTIWSSFWMKEAGMGRSAWSWGGWEGEAGMGRSAWSSDSKSLLYGPFSHQTSLGPYNFEQLIKDF